MPGNPTIDNLIKSHTKSKNYEFLSPALDLGYDKLSRSRNNRRLLRDGYSALAQHYLANEDYPAAILTFDRARQMAPHNWDLIRAQLEAFENFISYALEVAVQRDAAVMRGSISILQFVYQRGKYSKRVRNRCDEILEKIDVALPDLPDRTESRVTGAVQRIFANQFEDLTQEQRDELRSEILAEELINMLIEREKDKKEDAAPQEA